MRTSFFPMGGGLPRRDGSERSPRRIALDSSWGSGRRGEHSGCRWVRRGEGGQIGCKRNGGMRNKQEWTQCIPREKMSEFRRKLEMAKKSQTRAGGESGLLKLLENLWEWEGGGAGGGGADPPEAAVPSRQSIAEPSWSNATSTGRGRRRD